LSHNIIQFSSKLIRDMFTPLKKLKSIWLESLYLAYMPTYFFNRFPLLEYISLDDNILMPFRYRWIVIFQLRTQIITLKVIFISNIHFCIGNPVSERSMKRSYQTLHDKDEFTYVAYVVYCYEDLKWVKNNLLRKIEIEYGYKLCIPHRDFELGKVFADNIVDHMNLSKTVIPVQIHCHLRYGHFVMVNQIVMTTVELLYR
jgi:hypothetical protein